MNKIYKSRRGFTLMEIMIVIAIIVLLAAVVFISVHEFITKGDSASSELSVERSSFRANNAEKDDKFVSMGY